MNTRRLRARLDRLAPPSISRTTRGDKTRPCEFSIDPALARVLRDDGKRLEELEGAKPWSERDAPETEEERTLHERITEHVRTIGRPANYNFQERWDDSVRLSRLGPGGFTSDPKLKWILPEVRLYDVDDVDAEEAQLWARILAFDYSPEGRERARLNKLQRFIGWMSDADHKELDRLITLYPEPWCHPNFRFKHFSTPRSLEERRRKAEFDKRVLEKYRRYRAEKERAQDPSEGSEN
jgi:hypothetical protein